MKGSLSPAKATLLAVHFASTSDIASLRLHICIYKAVLRRELVLRILLTHLPETLDPSTYTLLLQEIQEDSPTSREDDSIEVDETPVSSLSEEQARKKARKLRLQELAPLHAPTNGDGDPLTLFLLHRAYKIDRDAGLLNLIPDLLLPFIHHCDAIPIWLVSTILPLIRRNLDYHPDSGNQLLISEFERLSDTAAIDYLLSETGHDGAAPDSIGRDLRGLLGPWFHHPARWNNQVEAAKAPGWVHFLEWLVGQSARSWRVAVQAIEEYNGPADEDIGPIDSHHPQDTKLDHLLQSYLRAALASAYSIQETSLDGLTGIWHILRRVRALANFDEVKTLELEADDLPSLRGFESILDSNVQSASNLRNDLLQNTNSLTSPTLEASTVLRGLTLSAFLLTRLGRPCSVRAAGEMTLLRDTHEQKGEFLKVVRLLSNNAPREDDMYWSNSRNDILWLHDWGREISHEYQGHGPFGMVQRSDIETELLKVMLTHSRFDLARSLYEDATDPPLTAAQIEEAVLSSAFHAFDNASNPNRTRGGLKKCDDIILAFTRTIPQSNPSVVRMRALLSATHGLSNYRLVLKQGEPFTPVVLRVHSDPISIIEKVLEQNPSAYTRVGEFVEISKNLAVAGLLKGSKTSKQTEASEDQQATTSLAEKRIIALCIEAALREDDFETAYSYVISRLGGPTSNDADPSALHSRDEWSWSAALKAGQYLRTQRSLQPTHLGTSSGNPEIRHLEQRLECLATALRLAPAPQLLEILKTFRRCEEQLDSAIAEEATKEDAWDAVGDTRAAPGSFDQPDPDRMYPPRNITATASARQAEEAPMSLFDLSRATARIASKNFTSLSGLHGLGDAAAPGKDHTAHEELDQTRVRKRDQLRDAATGTLVSGVGWLIGANMNRPVDGDDIRH